MAGIREIFAQNLKENRKRCGLSQEKLAEKAGISTHYIAVIELAKNFPAADVIERLAGALDIEVNELFGVTSSPIEELERLHREIISDVRRTIEDSVESAFAKREKKPKG
ncbi:MAG: helix-turn-helix domain-containing protein [Spirochaetaceae bacterium]|jgi:transcriptional regulator with XRE-family HTH domain|nr:helix-turn-helix domain-containing protein [Spirochaetaceae bacterium]